MFELVVAPSDVVQQPTIPTKKPDYLTAFQQCVYYTLLSSRTIGDGGAFDSTAAATLPGDRRDAACPRHQHNGDTRDPAKGPIARFGPCPKAPSTSGEQTNLGLLSAVAPEHDADRRSLSESLGRDRHFSPNAAPSGCAADRVGRGHERTTLSRVMRYLVPGFALTTSIESAPMRDVREISVKIGGVAGRPGQHLPRFSSMGPNTCVPAPWRARAATPAGQSLRHAARLQTVGEAARPRASQLLTELFDGQASPGDRAAERTACNLFMVRD